MTSTMGPSIDFEDELRAMLRRRAQDIQLAALAPGLPTPREGSDPHGADQRGPGGRFSGRGRPLLVAAAVLVVVALVATLVSGRDDKPSVKADLPDPPPTAPVEVAPPPEVAGLPAGVDLTTAPSLWTSSGGPTDVANAYLNGRLALNRRFVLTDRQPEGPAVWASVPWRVGGSPSNAASDEPTGVVYLRRDPTGWSVVAALARGTSLAGIDRAGGAVTGTIESSVSGVIVAADVTTLGGIPVPGSPEPGIPEPTVPDGFRVGTAGQSDGGSLAVDVAVAADEVAVVRASLHDGDVYAVSEVALVPPSGPPPDPRPAPTSSSVPGGPGSAIPFVWRADPDDPAAEEAGAAARPASPDEAADRFLFDWSRETVDSFTTGATAPSGAVDITIRRGQSVMPFVVAPLGDSWQVIEIGGGGLTLTEVGGDVVPTWDPSIVPDGAATFVTYVRDGTQGWRRAYSAGRATAPPGAPTPLPVPGPPLTDVEAAFVVWFDAAGELVGIAGNPL